MTRIRSLAAYSAVILTLASCKGDPVAPVVTTIAITPPAPQVEAGSSTALAAEIRDQNGKALLGKTIAWSSADSRIASVSATSGLVTGVSAGSTSITAAADGKSGVVTVTVTPIPVSSVVVGAAPASLIVGESAPLTVSMADRNGVALSGRSVSWTSSPASVASVDAAGVVRALAVGTAQISATSEGVSGSATIIVRPPPVATVTVSAPPSFIVVGQTTPLTAALADRTGAALTGRTVTWRSSSSAVASVDGSGAVSGVAAGTAQITASSEGIDGTTSVTVVAPGTVPPSIASVLPTTLVPGANATIAGVGFDPVAAKNSVTIRGVPATVLGATATQLTVSIPCVQTGPAGIVVTVNNLSSNSLAQSVAATQRTIGVGQALVLTSGAACNELVTAGANARYLVAVFNGSVSQNSLMDFEIGGNVAALNESVPRIAAASRASIRRGVRTRASSPEARRDSVHFAFLERERAQYPGLRARAATSRVVARARAAAALPNLGDVKDLFYSFTGGCNDVSTVLHVRAIYIGSRAIIWEDAANTLQSAADATLAGYYQRLGQIFDQDQYQSIKTNFGDPLRRDALTDADGRVHMIFTQKVNGSGAAAFVTSCDQYPREVLAGSNFGEYFYGSVPVTAGSNLGNTNFPDGWYNFMGRTVVHEVKHIASLAARVANNAPSFEASWLEEGTARHAEELWVRESLHKVAWKSNTGFGSAATNGIFCDFHPENTTCNAADALRRPSYGMRRQFNELREKLIAPWDWSPYGDGTGQSGSVFYQTAWSLVRYSIDRYGSTDAAFLTALTSSGASGLLNLAAVAGVPSDQLIGAWGLAMFADDYPGLASASPDIQFPTWNLRSIYAGLNADATWSTRWNTPFPIQPVQLPFGSFVSQRTGLRGGAHAYYEISGAATPAQLLSLRAIGGGSAPALIRIAITRLQ